ncbi:MAG TPA: SMC family ATPase [Candidatus Binataceae bacterium]|nr:SMC family ATPase [Candidatus Binataceae bacterium]
MRPLRLRIENFTCFRDPVELNFEGLNLFAIIGPTGAGKSSLLDAMIFALYGRVPRIGGKGLSELISLGRERMSAVFDFALGNRRFRVARAIRRRTGATQVQLDEIGAGGELPVCSGVRETDDKIKQLVGLAYEAFTQAVVLPQGEFANFLRSAPGEQRKILRDLLRLQVYERMRDLAARKRDDLKTLVGQLEDRLTKDYAGATGEALESRRQQERELADQIKRLAEELKRLEDQLNILRRRRDQTRELEEKRMLLAQLIKKEPSIKASENKADAARRAAPIIPLVEATSRALQRVEKTQEDAKRAKAERDAERAAIQKLKSTLDRATREAEKISELRKQVSALDQVLGQIKTRDSLQTRLMQAGGKVSGLKAELEAAKKQQKNGAAELERRQSLLTKIKKDLESIGYNPELDHALDAVRNAATVLTSLRETMAQKAAEAESASERAKREQENFARSATALEKANERLKTATEGLTQAQAARDAAHQQHAAAILRRQVRLGEPCPVCDQPVTKRPATVPAPHLDAVERKLDKARNDEAAVRKAVEEARAAEATAKASANEIRRAAEKAAKDLEKARAKVDSAEGELDAKVGTLVGDEEGGTIERRTLSGVARVAELRRRHQDASGALADAQKAYDETRNNIEKATREVEKETALLTQAESEIRGLQDDVDRITSEIGKVTQAPDPKAERERLVGVCTDLEDALIKARREHGEAEKRLSAAETRADETDKVARQAVKDADEAQKKAREAAVEAGFQDEAALKKAALQKADIERLDAEVRGWTRNRDAAAKREKELLDELGDDRVSEDALQKAQAVFSNHKRAHGEALSEHARCGQDVRHLEEQVKRAIELARKLREQRAVHSLYTRLADDLRSERFQAFLLDEVFRDLVHGASERLWNLTEVYRLEWRDGTFYVVDHDNARQRRTADTLSGGETFLASLALALELSEQVQRASGAVPLDSLFIDEGFGTLDRETLDDAASAIERLPKNGRTVGIITHLEELSARLPARVRVEKRNGSSQIIADILAN